MSQLMLFALQVVRKDGVDLMGAEFSESIDDLWKDSQVDVVVELMGGVDVAKNLINSALLLEREW